MPIQIKAWKCQYCSRYRTRRGSITRHEEICFKNPDRKILEGQMAIFATMPRELLQWNSYGVEGSDFQEPIDDPSQDLAEKYKWWPKEDDGSLGLGYVFSHGKWEKIDGYVPPYFAPGFSWRDEHIPECLKEKN